ncbi:MAG: efflux RND transporter periplasmic adaptor subunit [Flavobacteriales bacterium]|nr:efflux RND transporter periplasmic adaptor subunit [Flavobacteriales bacterium]
MKTKLNLLALATIAILLVACGEKSKADQLTDLKIQQAALADQIRLLESEIELSDTSGTFNKKIRDVKVAQMSRTNFQHFIEIQGYVDTEDNVTVSAKTPGIVTQVLVVPGQSVSAGQVMAKLDDNIYVKQLEGMQTQLALATDVFNRQKKLWDQKIGSEVQYLTAKTNKEGLEKQVQAMQETIDLTRIKSPISGTVDAVDLKVGQTTAPGVPAIRVVNLSNLKVKGEIAEAYSSKVVKGNPVLLHFPDLDRDIESKVIYAAKVINPMTRTFTAEVALPGNASDFRPNMVAILKVIDYQKDSSIVIPINIIQNVGNAPFIYVAVEEGGKVIAKKRSITTGVIYNGSVEVISGISEQDNVIVSGQSDLSDGIEIKY